MSLWCERCSAVDEKRCICALMTAEQIPDDVLDDLMMHLECEGFGAWVDTREAASETLTALDRAGYLHPGLKPCRRGCGAGAGEACRTWDGSWPCPNADRRRREDRP